MGTTLLSTGCIPNAMRVDRANHPKYQEQYVRFRETYFFRVYDYCRDVKGRQQIVADALYRFRMVGKAHPLTTRVRFEAGILPKSAIEPFNSTIEYDRDTGRFNYRSFEANQGEQARKDQLQAARELVDFAANIVRTDSTPAPAEDNPALKSKFAEGAQKLVTASLAAAERYVVAAAPPATPQSDDNADTEEGAHPADAPAPATAPATAPAAAPTRAPAPPTTTPSTATTASTSSTTPATKSSVVLASTVKPAPPKPKQPPSNHNSNPAASETAADPSPDTQSEDNRVSIAACRQLHRGFQILGPEGWRVFDQDERLIVAMSSSGQPLISTLKELSGRILNSQPDSAAGSSAYTLDELKVTRAEGNLSRVDVTDTESLIKSLESAVKDLGDDTTANTGVPQ